MIPRGVSLIIITSTERSFFAASSMPIKLSNESVIMRANRNNLEKSRQEDENQTGSEEKIISI